MHIYFLQFNSKINRIVKTFPTLDGYRSFIVVGPKDATHFPYADGVVTRENYNFETETMPDYAVIVDEQENVVSRWYIEQTFYTRKGQYRIDFRRDVLADFKEKVLNATCLIEKATVSDNDPAIFNQEPITFNQIKKSEKLLKDKSGTAWLVGYLSSDNASEKLYTATTDNQIMRNVENISDWEFYKYQTQDFIGAPNDMSYNATVAGFTNHEDWFVQYAYNEQGAALPDTQNPTLYGFAQLRAGDYAYQGDWHLNAKIVPPGASTYSIIQIKNAIMDQVPLHTALDSIFLTQIDTMHTDDEEGYLKSLDGTLIHDTTANKTYRINIRATSLMQMSRYAPPKNSALFNEMVDIAVSTNMVQEVTDISSNTKGLYVKYFANHYRLSLTQVDVNEVNLTITASRLLLNDAPYTMFAMPYNGVSFKQGSSTYMSDPEASIAMARTISLELMSSGALYDLQLLPYCPRQDLVGVDFIDLRSALAIENVDYELIKDDQNNVKGFMLFAKQSSFTFDINEAIQITEKKVQNQVDMWRLCSPNYNGVFEFNAAKNNGVDYFNVDCTYRPYNPYIHVNPNFKELYGNDYDDARGLICSGDFSMPASTDKWLEYEAQNKNYQQSFDRQIQHMEIEQKYQRIQQIAGAVAGVGQGALMGGMIGGVAGAAVGGAASLAGGITDVVMGEKLRSEQIRYTKDQFTFSLENIKALPNTLAKVSAFNKNNKIFPFLEYYSCTDIEKQAFRDTLTYDGMTVNRIGRIIDFLRDNELQYIRARLIRCDIHDDLHIVDTIATEMEKGAYYDTRSN